MSPIVVDCSVTLAWSIPDEGTSHSKNLFSIVSHQGAVVPSLWRIEVGNGLLMGLRRKRIDKRRISEIFEILDDLALVVDSETLASLWPQIFNIAEIYNLTVYDATYLELALRRNLPLATYDKELRTAATTAGIQLL